MKVKTSYRALSIMTYSRFSFLFLILFYSNPIIGQFYQTINAGRAASFQTEVYNMEKYNGYLNFCQNDDCIIGIRIDSIALDSQTFFFPIYARGNSDYNIEICTSDSWLGPKVDFLADGKNLFYNGAGDTIMIQTNAIVGENWNLYKFSNGDYFEATISSIISEAVLGITDSVKYINLQLKDPNGSNLPSDFNDFQIAIGKEMGLITTPDFFHFPNDTSSKVLVGLTNPDVGIQLLESDLIYDYQVGLERHTYYECYSYWDYSYSLTHTREIILEIDTTANEIFHTIDRRSYGVSGGPFGADKDTFDYRDTVVQEMFELDAEIMDLHPFEMSFDDTFSPQGFNFQYFTFINDKIALEVKKYSNSYTIDCMSELLDNWASARYMACLGLVSGGVGSLNTECSESLLYYKKGAEEWGTPIDFDALTPVNEIKTLSAEYKVFPNPASESVVIQSKNNTAAITSWKLYDLNGVLRKQANNLHLNQVLIDLTKLPTGVYQLEIVNHEGTKLRQSLVVTD